MNGIELRSVDHFHNFHLNLTLAEILKLTDFDFCPHSL